MLKFLQLQKFNYTFAFLLTLNCAFSMLTSAQAAENTVSITDAWVRATNPGQEVGAAYLTLLSAKDTTLTSVVSDVTKSVEIHNMTMQNGIMKMRMIDTLSLTAGKPYKLAPGGFHLMLFDLKKPLTVGEHVTFVLNFKNKSKVEFKQSITVRVQSAAEAP